MKVIKEFKWIKIVYTGCTTSGKTKLYIVMNKDQNEPLAEIRWHTAYRRYALFPLKDTYWEEECLTDLVSFLKELKEARENAN